MKQSKMYRFKNFGGVDLSSSPLEVSPRNAVSARNFIVDNGVLRKRKGSIETDRYPGRINGYWQIKIDNEVHTIAHAGNMFYCSNAAGKHIDLMKYNANNEPSPCARVDSKVVPEYILDKRSFAVERDNKLYIACGDYLVFGKWNNGKCELRRVYNNFEFDSAWNLSGTHIPMTTLSIDNFSVKNDTDLLTLEDVNLLTPWRKNGLVGVSGASGDALKYYLDAGSIQQDTTVRVIVDFDTGATTETRYYEAITSGGGEDALKDNAGNIVGHVNRSLGMIRFNSPQPPTLPDDSNITVIYCPTYDANSVNSSKITKCTIGCLYGLAGNNNQLFLTGGADSPNIDYYSAPNNFTYFPDINYTALGSKNCGIAGYSRLGDGSLAVHKFANSGDEASIYYRSTAEEPVMYDIRDTNGIITGTKKLASKTIFPIKAGTPGIGIASSYANAAFVGDNLVVCEGGVYAITLTSNTSVAERVARERSSNISRELRRKNLSDAVGCVFNGKYYLSVEGKCYVADCTMKIQDNKAQAMDTFNYEWWVFDNFNARIWINIDNTLFYGDDSGRIIQINTNSFKDTRYETLSNVGVDYVNNRLSIALKTDVKCQDKIILSGDDVYERAIDKITKIAGSNDKFASDSAYRSGWTVFADNVGNSGLCVDTAYNIKIAFTANGEKYFTLCDVSGANVQIGGSIDGVILCRKINGRELYVSSIIDDMLGGVSTRHIKLCNYWKDANRIDIVLHKYKGAIPSVKSARVVLDRPVVAEWLTGISDLGAPYLAKTLRDMYITPDAVGGSLVKFGYQTYSSSYSAAAQGASLFSFRVIDFNAFSFNASDFPQGYHVDIMDRDRNYVQVFVASDTDTDASINNLAIRFVINREIKGVE